MKTSESISKLSASLVKAQRNIGAAAKGSANPFFKSKYADLGSVMEACKSALNDEGITVLQPVQSSEAGDFVETILLHESGEFISSSMKLVLAKQDMQAYGSAVSYARRYSLQSLVFIPAMDDDGESSMARPTERPKAESVKREPVLVPEKFTASVSALTGVVPVAPAPATSSEVPKSRTTFRGKSTTLASVPAVTPAVAPAHKTPLLVGQDDSEGALNF